MIFRQPTDESRDRIRSEIVRPRSRSLLRGCVDCLTFSPFATLAIVIYAGLRTSAIYPDNPPVQGWHAGFSNIGDYLVAFGLLVDSTRRSFTVPRGVLAMLGSAIFVITLSFVNTNLPQKALFDAFLYWFRFAVVFTWTLWVARRVGSHAVEALFAVVFLVIAASSLFVFGITFDVVHRMNGSGMSVAGFAQTATAMALIALVRTRTWLLVVALIFLVMTFSNTSWIAFSVLLIVFFVLGEGRGHLVHRLWKPIAAIVVIVVGIVFVLSQTGQLAYQVDHFVRLNEYQDLHGRVPIWDYAWHLAQGHEFAWFGNGYNSSPSVLSSFAFSDDFGNLTTPAHFHSIWLELTWGVGIPGLLFLALIVHRLTNSWRHRRQLSLMLFGLFAISQTVDFTFITPKPFIIWALVLGIAEADYRVRTVRIAVKFSESLTSPSVAFL